MSLLPGNNAIGAIRALGESFGKTGGAGFTLAANALESGSFSGARNAARKMFLKDAVEGEKGIVSSAKGWDWKDNVHTGRLAATAATTWVAGNAGVGMIKGVFTDSNGNFDMPLVPFV